MTTKTIRVTLVKSLIGTMRSHRDCVAGLGLKRRGYTVTVSATPENLGMVKKINYLVKVER